MASAGEEDLRCSQDCRNPFSSAHLHSAPCIADALSSLKCKGVFLITAGNRTKTPLRHTVPHTPAAAAQTCRSSAMPASPTDPATESRSTAPREYSSGSPRAGDLKVDVNPARGVDVGIDFILQPVFRNFAPHRVDIPAKAAAEISGATAEAQARPWRRPP